MGIFGAYFLIIAFLVGGGFYGRWMGQKIIREKRLRLSLKQRIVWGKSHMEGDEAVFWGKFSVGLSYVFFGLAGLMVLIGILAFGGLVAALLGGGGRNQAGNNNNNNDAFNNRRGGAVARNNDDPFNIQPAAAQNNIAARNNNAGATANTAATAPQNLGRPTKSLPRNRLDKTKAQRSKMVGSSAWGDAFESDLHPDKFLVGLIVGINKTWDTPANIQAIYQDGQRYVKGRSYGSFDSVKKTVMVLAKPGYAVAGMKIWEGTSISGIELLFANVDASGHLNLSDTYWGELIGKPWSTSHTVKFDVDKMAIGLHGYEYKEYFESIGVVSAPRTDQKPCALHELRTWTAVGGKFDVQARFIKEVNGVVELVLSNNQRVEVDLEDLSREDLVWLEQKQLVE